MTVVKGIIREIGKSSTIRVGAARWYGVTIIEVQNEETGKTYTVRLSSRVMERCNFLPRVGLPVIIHGFVEEAEHSLSDYYVTHVTHIKQQGAGVKRIINLSENDDK